MAVIWKEQPHTIKSKGKKQTLWCLVESVTLSHWGYTWRHPVSGPCNRCWIQSVQHTLLLQIILTLLPWRRLNFLCKLYWRYTVNRTAHDSLMLLFSLKLILLFVCFSTIYFSLRRQKSISAKNPIRRFSLLPLKNVFLKHIASLCHVGNHKGSAHDLFWVSTLSGKKKESPQLCVSVCVHACDGNSGCYCSFYPVGLSGQQKVPQSYWEIEQNRQN